MDDIVLAIDIGGTKIAAAVVDRDGRLVHSTVRPTAGSRDPERVFAGVAEALTELAGELPSRTEPLRIGVSSAGPIDGPAGTVSPVNIGAWRGFPLLDRVRSTGAELLGIPPRVGLAGDGHCFALGEHWLGAGRGLESMVGMVLSTGVGGGAVVGNRLFTGTTGNSVHLGHISVNAWGPRCVCGAYGCVEMYARGPALVTAARQAGWTGGTDAQALAADARAGNEIALRTIDYGMRALAAGIAATAVELDVATFVLGGGVSRAGEVILAPLRRHLADFAVLDYVADLEIRPAVLENAGLLGAGALAYSLEED